MLPQDETASITVVAGDSVTMIATELERAGLISDKKAFISRVRELGAESLLQAGTYTFAGHTPIDDIIATLRAGSGLAGDALVVPEGFTLTQIAARVESVSGGRITAAEFTEAAQAKRWVKEFPFTASAGDASLEGMLFPATYGITSTTTADGLIREMLGTFQWAIQDVDLSAPAEAGLSWYQWVILASIVQRETTPDDEEFIASVFYNRMAIDMPLQSDATTAYAVGDDPTPAQLADYDDPYNTYSYDRPGVCIPTPIGNPGLVCLVAAAEPATSDYLYFYATTDASGKLITKFAVTYDEHLANIAADAA